MATMDVDLGSLELESKSSGLQLQLRTLARFAPSPEDDVDALRQRLIHEQLNTDSVDRVWIERGHKYRLELSLHLELGLDEKETHTVMETLVNRLRAAKVVYT